MNQLFLIALVPFALGLGANATYELLKNLRTGRKHHSSHLLGSHWLYWHNSRWMRGEEETPPSSARLSIYRDYLHRLRCKLREAQHDGEIYEGYDYDGTVDVTSDQVHLRLEGIQHGETCYAILDRGLDRSADYLPGLFLLTANDATKGAMAIRCFVTSRETTLGEVEECLGKKIFIDSRRIAAPWRRRLPNPALKTDASGAGGA